MFEKVQSIPFGYPICYDGMKIATVYHPIKIRLIVSISEASSLLPIEGAINFLKL